MTLGGRYPGASWRHAWPVAVSLAVHTLLVLVWLHFGNRVRLHDDTPQPLSVLLLLKPPQPPAAARPPKAQTPAQPHGLRKQADEATAILPPAAPRVEEAPAAPTAAQVPAATTPSALDILNAAKQDIRKGKNPAPAGKANALRQGDSAWSRFENGVASAHVERSPGPVTDSYTAPDGQTYYRTRVGNTVVCRKTGSTGPPAPWRSDEAIRAGAGSVATLDVANSAGSTLCPESERDWVRR